jgi:hypothetical protein
VLAVLLLLVKSMLVVALPLDDLDSRCKKLLWLTGMQARLLSLSSPSLVTPQTVSRLSDQS